MWSIATGFILGIAMAGVLGFIGMEIGKSEMIKEMNEDYVFNILEENLEKDNLIDELVRENKIYKKSMDSFNEERNSDYWG